MITRRLRILGQVQGVGYRDALREKAERLGVAGWVRNCRDGTVEAVVQGAPEAVEQLIAWARGGPPAARIDDLRVADDGDAHRYTRFERRPTV